jgi:hypothetical protein
LDFIPKKCASIEISPGEIQLVFGEAVLEAHHVQIAVVPRESFEMQIADAKSPCLYHLEKALQVKVVVNSGVLAGFCEEIVLQRLDPGF